MELAELSPRPRGTIHVRMCRVFLGIQTIGLVADAQLIQMYCPLRDLLIF